LQAWNVYGVLNYLQALVEKSMITQILQREKEGLEQFTATDGYDYEGGSNVLKTLGYYSMIGLLRIHCLLGDYHTGLKCLALIDLNQQGGLHYCHWEPHLHHLSLWLCKSYDAQVTAFLISIPGYS
jgi:hypothetical protein